MGELRYPGYHLGEQGQEVTRTADYTSPVPFEGHKSTLLSTEKGRVCNGEVSKGEGSSWLWQASSKWLDTASQHPACNPVGTRWTVPSGRNGS